MKNQKRKKKRRRNKKQEETEVKGNHLQEGKSRERNREIKKVVKIGKMSKQVKLLSVNVKGLNSPPKRRKIFSKLLKTKVDIIFIQETYIREKDRKLLENPKLGKIFIASSKQKKKGVALYIKKELDPELVFAAEDGRLLIVEISKEEKKSYWLIDTHQMKPEVNFISN